jgi:hypothetical protein
MAMHKPRKQKRFQDGGYLMDSYGNRVKDGSGEDIMTGSGREEAETQKRMQAAEAKLASEVQDMMKAKATTTEQPIKTNDGDVDERDRRMEAMASMPARMPTRPGQGAVMAKPRIIKPAAKKEETSVESAVMAGEARKRQKSAVMTDEARKRRAGKEKAFAAAQTPAAAAQERARLGDQSIKRVTPELGLVGGASSLGLKALHGAAKRLAGTGAKTATKTATTGAKSPLRQKTEELIKEDKNPGRSVSSAPASPKGSLKEKTKELIKSDRTAKSNEMSKQMAEKQTPTKFASKKSTSAAKKPVASKRTKKFNEDESGMDFKRGGSVSSRADGCAQRGKTRCKVY